MMTSLLVKAILLVVLAGCQSADRFQATSVDIASKHPSLAVAAQRGNSKADIDQIEATLNPSTCLWIARGDVPRLDWEAVVTLTVDPPGQTYHVGSCDLRNVDAPDGTFDGRRYAFLPFAPRFGGSLERCIRTVSAIAGCESATSLREACVPVHPACPATGSNWNLPYCGKECLQPIPDDGAFALKYPNDPALGGGERMHGDHRAFISPYYFRVEHSRQFRQELIYSDSDTTAGSGRLAYRWPEQRKAGDTGPLREDFSPTLFISRVRAFQCPDPSGRAPPFSYLKLEKLGLGDRGGAVVTISDCSPDDYDPTVIPMAKCPRLGALTPTRAGASPGDFAREQAWRVEVRDGSPDGNEGLQSGDRVCVEFHVNDSESRLGPGIELPYQLPDQFMSATPLVVRGVGRIHNDDGGLQGHRIQWHPETSPGLSLAVDSIAGLPPPVDASGGGMLLAGSSIHLNLTVDRSQEGDKEATVVLDYLDSDRRPQEARETVRIRVLGPGALDVAPDHLDLVASEAPPWKKRVAITNGGFSPLNVTAIGITGRNGPHYRLYEADGATPLPRTAQIQPGELKVVTVALCPRVQGERDLSATLDIVADSGRVPAAQVLKRVPLRAVGRMRTGATCFQ